ncbi:MAG TPA: hypothetical protein VGX16_01165, partial [Solirubrobacteraceae bacterium]|nr:hypothetical protein [Solirubrobacteraceae bacterium]
PALAGFGFQKVDSRFLNRDGSADVQAGSHPFAVVTSFKFNTKLTQHGVPIPDGDAKDIEVEPPLGLIGNPIATPRCTLVEFNTPDPFLAGGTSGASCPDDTQIGVARIELNPVGAAAPPTPLFYGIYNLVPPPGVPAEFGFNPLGVPIVLTPMVRTGKDYGLKIVTKNSNQTLRVYGVTATLWGVPADHSHDEMRGKCLPWQEGELRGGECSVSSAPKPFLRLPTRCSSMPLVTTFRADSWQNPVRSVETEGVEAKAVSQEHEGNPVGLAGCEFLDFSPKVRVKSDTPAGGSPAGLDVELGLAQSENPTGLAESDLRKAVFTLPPGVSVSPSAADGLGACTDTSEPERPEGEIALHSTEAVKCPPSSKIGSVLAETPLLESPLKGSVYLAQPEHNPFNSLLAFYVVVEGSGVLVKLAGHVEANLFTGQLTTRFEETPQLPFSDLKLKLFGGPRAALLTPQTCGIYQARSLLTSWSSSTETPVSLESPFSVTTGCSGGFAPTMVAGTTSNQAALFSPFTTTISRSDQDQNLSRITVKTPPGLLGLLSKVTLCGEPQAAQGSCPAASQIGHVSVSAGGGPDPLNLPLAGKPQDPVFLTGPYNGAPFGLSVAVPAEAGPFNLGVIVVRAAITVDPHTAQVTITSDPLPALLQGIPLDVRTVNVIVDREGFIFNPTNCEPSSVTGTIISTQNASASLSSRFQATSCASLPFKPKFTVSTSAKTSRHKGASLDVKISYPKGTEANIRKVAVDLPGKLPSRLTTIQKACSAEVFNANPARCPPASNIGTATAITPILSVPLTGPAYLVSYGNAAFPQLVIVLQGEGIKLELAGSLFIDKHGVTKSSFETVPDAPVSSFELKLPQGPQSALATAHIPAKAHGNLCHTKLVIPTKITAQNGAIIKQSTKIHVTGCRRAKHGGK